MTLIDTERTTLPTPSIPTAEPTGRDPIGEATSLIAELSVERPTDAAGGRTPEDEAVAWWRRVLNRVDRLNAGRPDGGDNSDASVITLRVESLRSSEEGGTRSARITLGLELPAWIAPEAFSQQLRPIAPPTSLLRTARRGEFWSVPD